MLHDSVNSRIQCYWDLSKEHIASLQKSGKISKRLEAQYLGMLAIMMEPEDTLPLKSTKIDSSSSNSLTTTTTNSLSLESPKEQNQNNNTTTTKSGD